MPKIEDYYVTDAQMQARDGRNGTGCTPGGTVGLEGRTGR
jgi:hypothetical protein